MNTDTEKLVVVYKSRTRYGKAIADVRPLRIRPVAVATLRAICADDEARKSFVRSLLNDCKAVAQVIRCVNGQAVTIWDGKEAMS